MKPISTQRKIYIGALSIALVVLFWDKVLNTQSVSEPQSTQANQYVAPLPTKPKPALSMDEINQLISTEPDTTETQSVEAPEIPVEPSETTQNETPDNIDRNLFTPTDTLKNFLDSSSASDSSDPLSEEAAEVRPQYDLTLKSVMIGKTASRAMINNTVMQVGSYIGPCQLLDIQKDHVTLSTPEGELMLELNIKQQNNDI